MGINILGSGKAVPNKRMFNNDFTEIETSDEWIYSRTGIKSRFILTNETNYDLALVAAKKAITNSNINPSLIKVVIVATMTPDQFTPATASKILKPLGITNAMAFDINVACSGFVYALNVGYRLLNDEDVCLVVASERVSSLLDFKDRSTCVLFGDGAGALLFKRNDKEALFYGKSKTDEANILFSGGLNNLADYKLKMKGPDVFRFALEAIKDCFNELQNKGIDLNDIDLIIPHQANKRIIESVAKKNNIPIDKFYLNLEKYGNTSAASCAIALSEAIDSNMLKKGMKVLLIAFGSGLSWGYVYFEN